MVQIIKGNIIQAKELGKLDCLPNGYLVTEDGVIRAVSQTLPQEYAGLPVTDYGDQLILQSFADMHLHGAQYPMLGNGLDLPLLDWLNSYAFPTESRFQDEDYARMVYRKLVRELLDNGTTRVVMFASLHAEGTLILMEEMEKAGLTGYVGKVNMDRNNAPELNETTEESKASTLRWLDGCKQFKNVKPILTPRFTPSCTDELMTWLGETAKERNLYVHSHISENNKEIELVGQLHPDCKQYWETYAKFGLWKDHTVMAHCIYSDERERKAMKDHNVLAVHCPSSNNNICSGVAPVRIMLEEGVWVALGSDISGGSQLSMMEVMQQTVVTSKFRCMKDGDRPLDAAEAYYLATSAGHKYFGDQPGFAPGNPLHAVVVDDSTVGVPGEQLTLPQRLERLLYRAKAEHITTVYSQGRKVKG